MFMVIILHFWGPCSHIISHRTWKTWILFLTVLQGWCWSYFIFTHWSWLVTACTQHCTYYTSYKSQVCFHSFKTHQISRSCSCLNVTVLSVLACYCGPSWHPGLTLTTGTGAGVTGGNINQSSSSNKRDGAPGLVSACLFWTETLDCEDLRIVDFWFELRISSQRRDAATSAWACYAKWLLLTTKQIPAFCDPRVECLKQFILSYLRLGNGERLYKQWVNQLV